MTEVEEIVQALLDADQEDNLKAKVSEDGSAQPVRRIHEEDEDDDEETIKDILGPDFYDPPKPSVALPGSVERFGRWANVTIGGSQFCISYITPVAAVISGRGLVITDRDWSTTTSNHITKWAEEIGFTDAGGACYKWRDFIRRFPRIPQEELNTLFKEAAAKVNWSKRDRKSAETVNMGQSRGYKYVEPEHKVRLPNWTEPEEL